MTIGFYEGFWSMGDGEAFVGWPLAGVWAIEAASIIGLAVFVPFSMLRDRLFCETCSRWINEHVKLPHREPVADSTALVNALEGSDFEALAAMAPRNMDEAAYTSVWIHCCDQCQELGYLDVKSCVLVESKDGVATKTTEVVNHLIVPPALIDALRKRWPEEAVSDMSEDEGVPSPEPEGAA
jgi:hypothetical protein